MKKTNEKKPEENEQLNEKELFKKEQAKRADEVFKKLEKRGFLPKRNKRWRNFKTTVILLFILSFSALSVYMSFNLDYCINEMMAPHARLLMLTFFAIFMQVISVVVWDDLLEQIDDDYFLPVLLYIGFWGFILAGAVTYGTFMFFCAGQWIWHSLVWHHALFPALFGTLLFASFVYKVVHIFGDN